jgi:hypothetical protein
MKEERREKRRTRERIPRSSLPHTLFISTDIFAVFQFIPAHACS